MFCQNCGSRLPSNAQFCPQCGSRTGSVKAPNVLRLHCEDCNGIMDIDESHEALFCPYCGSKKIVLESDDVKIERIKSETKKERSRAYRDVETTKAKRDIEVSRDKKEMQKEDNRHEIITGIISFIGLLLLGYFIGKF